MSKLFTRALSSTVLTAAAVCVAAPAHADQTVVVGDDSGPSGPNPLLFTSGLVTTAIGYTPAVLVAMNSSRPEDDYLYAPVVGPWLDLAARDDIEDDGLNRSLLVVDGIVQAVGVLQLAASFMFIGSDDDVAGSDTGQVQASFVPTRMPNNGYGVLAVGTF